MTAFGVQVVASGNTRAVRSEFQKLIAQANILNASLERAGTAGVDGYQAMQRGVANNSAAFRAAAASSGMYESELVKIRSATDQYTESLSRQKISLKDWAKNRQLASAAYKDQLRLQEMVARRLPIAGPNGKQMFDVMVPTEVNKNLDTFGRRVGWAREQLRSFSTQMINWGKNTQWAGRQLMVGFTLPVAAFGAAAGVAAYQIDKELTRIQKVYDTTVQVVGGDTRAMAAAEKELAAVREAGKATALDAAKSYGAAATDTLAVQAELAATGLQGENLQKSTTEVMRISTLGELERADAIKATIALQSVFKMNNKELTDSFNYMNAVENATSLQLVDFAQAIPIAAGPVKAFGGDIYELGVLMTAMKERGIDAAQGANAIKATMQRLSRPSKQIQQEFSELTNGSDIVKLVDESNGLLDIFTKIGNITRGLDDDAKRKIYAGLFGGWQVTRMSAIVEGMQDVQKGVGQAGKAFQLAQGDAEQWGAQADTEIKRIQESISGKFMRSFQTLKMELASMGEPFVQAATLIINGVTKVISAFNGLPKIMKMFIAVPLVILAIAGPLIMLTGLMANFAGNIGKAMVAFMGLFGKMELLNKESALAKMAAVAADNQYQSTAKSVRMLTAELNALVRAQHEANMRMTMPAGFQIAPTSSPTAYGPQQASNQQQIAAMMAQQQTANGRYRGANGQFISSNIAQQQAMNRLGQEYMVMNNQIARDATVQQQAMQRTVAAQQVNARTTTIVNSNMGGAALAGGAMAASMVLMSTNSGEVGHNLGQFLMIGSIAVPAMKALVGATGGLAKTMWSAAGAQIAMARSSAASAAGTAALVGRWASVGAVIRGVGTGIAGLMGPVGWVTAGIAVLGFGAFKLWKHQKAIVEEEKNHAKAIAHSTDAYADLLDIHMRDQKILSNAPTFAGQGKLSAVGLAEEMQKTDAGKELVGAYGDAGDGQKNVIAMRLYLDTLNAVGGSAKKAQRAVEALYIAGGADATKAEYDAAKFASTLGDTEDAYDRAFGASLYNALSGSVEAMDVTANEMANVFSDGLFRADKEGAVAVEKTMDRYQSIMLSTWGELWDQIESTNKDALARMGIDNGNEMRQFMLDHQDMNAQGFETKWNIDPGQGEFVFQQFMQLTSAQREQALKLQREEDVIVQKLAQQLGVTREIHTLDELRETSAYRRMAVTKQNAEQLYAQLVTEAELSDHNKQLTADDRLRYRNMVRMLLGLDETKSLTADWVNESKKAKDEIGGAEGQVRRVNSALWGTAQVMDKITGKDMGGMMKDAMSSLQQNMSDNVMDNFTNQMDAAIASVEASGQRSLDALQANGDRQQKGLERRQEATQNAMERRQEAAQNALQRRQENATEALERRQEQRRKAVEEAYNRRIKAIEGAIEAEQKAEEIRKRIFDAEMTRLDRLNTEQNRNIDFNVALNSGDLDEAARIRNDMQSQESQWNLEDASNAGARGSDRRIKHLENRRDQVEKARDTELEAIKKIEDAEKKSLDRRLQAQERALQKRQEREQAAMERSQEREKNALQRSLDRQQKNMEAIVNANNDAEKTKWQDRQDYLEKSLQDFTNYVAYNEKDLRQHIKKWRSEHKDLSIYTKDQFGITADKINHYIETSVRTSMRNMANDIQWENNGSKIAKGMINGAFGISMSQFKKWMLTGKFPKNANPSSKNRGKSTAPSSTDRHHQATAHTGGFLGRGMPNSRKGVARTQKGLHPSEVMVRAKRGEFVVNERATEQHRGLLEAVNSGKYATAHEGGYLGGGKDKLGFAGAMEGMLAASVRSAIDQGIQVGAEEGRQRQAALALSGGFYDGTFRDYHMQNVKPWVAEAANYLGNKFNIGTIGGYSYRTIYGTNTLSDHATGTALDFMTNNFKVGNALAAEVIKLKGPLDAKYVIYRQRYNDLVNGWSRMSDRGSPTQNHMDHVHVSFDSTGDVGDLPALTVGGVGGGPAGSYGGRSYNGTQMHNAATIASVGRSMGMSMRDIKIGIMTSIAESGLINVGYGDRDSLGLFQQRPSQGWGSASQVQDPVYASRRFFSALRGVGSRDSMVPWLAAQAVQRSAFSSGSNYRPYWDDAGGILHAAHMKVGGTVLADGVPAVLHKNETVLTEPLSKKLKSSIGNLDKLDTLEEMDQLAAAAIHTQKSVESIKSSSGGGRGTGTGNHSGDGSGSGATTDLRTGTYNVWRKQTNAKTRGDLARLMKMADVLSLTEMLGKKKSLIPWIKQQGWGYYASRGHAAESGILWNNNRYAMEQADSKGLNPKTAKSGTRRNKFAAYALLRNRETGKRFWQIAAHTIGYAQRELPGALGIMREQYGTLSRLAQRLQKSHPVVLAGDFNTNPKKYHYKYDFKGLNDVSNKSASIDRIFASKGMKKRGSRMVKGMSSDHGRASLSQVTIPGLSVGGFTLNEGIARLHKNETVLTAPLSEQLMRGIDRLDTGVNATYNVSVYAAQGMNEDVLTQKVITALDRRSRRLPNGRIR